MDTFFLILRTVFDLSLLLFASFMLYDLLSFWTYVGLAAAYILVVWESERIMAESEEEL